MPKTTGGLIVFYRRNSMALDAENRLRISCAQNTQDFVAPIIRPIIGFENDGHHLTTNQKSVDYINQAGYSERLL